MNTIKATPEHWAHLEYWARENGTFACILELRDRIEALETATQAERPTDKELQECYTEAYYANKDRQGPVAQVAALRAVLERWGSK